MSKLEKIGFYTLSDARTEQLSHTSPLWRCELILTNKCNFRCTYCRGLANEIAQDMPLQQAKETLKLWIKDGLKNVRFSGGEPLLYRGLDELVALCREGGVERIAISSNGSIRSERYLELVKAGVNDFSISLDACCAATADKMAGRDSRFETIKHNIEMLSRLVYVTVGIVITEDNLSEFRETVMLAHQLGVADIRIITAAQFNKVLQEVNGLPEEVVSRYPILRYRVANAQQGRNVRGIRPQDTDKCYIVMDDSVVAGQYHFPCVIYMREHGQPIGLVGPNMRQERIRWAEQHNTHQDPICLANCLECVVDHNNKCAARFRRTT